MDDGAASLCGMEQSDNDNFDWTMGNGPTPSEETGPPSAYDGSYYIFIEASAPRQTGDTAKWVSTRQTYSTAWLSKNLLNPSLLTSVYFKIFFVKFN